VPGGIGLRRGIAMSPPAKRPLKKRNLAARALRSPLFRQKFVANLMVYKRRRDLIEIRLMKSWTTGSTENQ
jgi:hypothetical protein